jgi:flagellar protein FlaJ
MHNIEKQKLEKLKPYVMIGFMMVGLTSFITLMVIDSMSSVSLDTATKESVIESIQQKRDKDMRVFSYAVILQSWLAGLFIGKITTGSYSGGFLYAAILTLIAMLAAVIILAGMFDVGSMLGGGG